MTQLERALELAERGRGATAPNPMVGAVVARDGEIVGEGWHERAGEPHAEVHALAQAGERARGGTLYCTLEPCSHTGRTGPCVARIVDAGVSRVVAAMEDPNPLVKGRGFEYLRAHGLEVDVGLGAAGAIALNRPFATLMRERRPFVILKAATSLDGCIAEGPGCRTLLTSEVANRHAQNVRAEVDAIGVGVGTILVDDPRLTPRGAYRERPLVRVVFDRRLRTPADAAVLSTGDCGPVIIITTVEGGRDETRRNALEARGAQVEIAADGSVAAALACLGSRGVGSLLLEGGARLHAAAWDEGLIDFVRLYIAPSVIGADGVPLLAGRRFETAALLDRRTQPLGPDVLIEGYVHRPR